MLQRPPELPVDGTTARRIISASRTMLSALRQENPGRRVGQVGPAAARGCGVPGCPLRIPAPPACPAPEELEVGGLLGGAAHPRQRLWRDRRGAARAALVHQYDAEVVGGLGWGQAGGR